MRRFFGRLILMLSVLGPIWLGSGVALAAPVTSTSPAPLVAHPQLPPAASGGAGALVALRPQTVLATCSASSSPKACADAITTPANRLFQIILLILIEVGGALAVLLISVSILSGMVGLSAGEPRAVAHVIYKAGGIIVLVIVMVLAPQGLGQIFSGSSVQFQLPNIQQLIPLPGN